MNSGNLLNSLLGITSANASVAKSTAAKARAESTEKFHQALEQARPEVAARKPVARKEAPVNEPANATRPAPKPLARQDAQTHTNRADAQAKTLKDDQRVVKKAETADQPVADKRANDSFEGNSVEESSNKLQGEEVNVDALPVEGHQELVAIKDPLLALDGSMLATPIDTDEVDSALESPINLLSPALIQPLTTEESANENETDLSLSSEDVLVVDPSLMAINTPLSPIVTETDLVTDSDQPLAASLQIATSQLVSGGVSAWNDVQSSTPQAANGALAGQVNSTVIDGADAEADLALNMDVEAGAGESPDFALLNSKAALNKLAEATMTAATLDKTAPAADLKPAIISAAVEAMTRLTEAQSPAARAFVVQTGVPVTVSSPQWSQAVGDKVLWLAAQNVSAAEIRLDPPELGPMQVKVSVNQDQASVSFSSPHPAVREVLDQQLNRLREMFAEQGLNLVNVDVSDKSFTKREQEESAKHHRSGGEDEDELSQVAVSQAISMRLVDHYA